MKTVEVTVPLGSSSQVLYAVHGQSAWLEPDHDKLRRKWVAPDDSGMISLLAGSLWSHASAGTSCGVHTDTCHHHICSCGAFLLHFASMSDCMRRCSLSSVCLVTEGTPAASDCHTMVSNMQVKNCQYMIYRYIHIACSGCVYCLSSL